MSAVEQARQVLAGKYRSLDPILAGWYAQTLADAGLLRDEPVTVTTVEELDALPVRSVILTADHVAIQKDRHGRWDEGLSMSSTLVVELARKPVTVLYRPGDDG